ncbi:Atrophin-1 multi-domain protein [Roseateles sp.]|uniref:Atrophin-1 multi-domain protein n=1 Tax=Roseateles sp. TaxID=1971397 RepID=UPI0031CFB339
MTTYSSSRFGISAGLNACALAAALLAGCGGGGGGTAADAATASLETPPTAASAPVSIAAAPSAPASEAVAGVSALATDTVARTAAVTAAFCSAGDFGSFKRPFSPDSPWNSRPVSPVLGSATIPTAQYTPSVASGAWSTAAFEGTAGDPPMVITGSTSQGIWDPDSEIYRPSVTIAHWPAATTPATGTDGHAEVVDTTSGVVHSFWGLKQVNGAWVARQYAWTPLAGRGMGDPSHYYQGARAAGVSTLGGLIRIGEDVDGDTMYRHALAMSLDATGLSAAPTYRFPATSADSNAATTNSGQIPMGSLMMLPPSFDAQALATPELRKVAETLKAYGAYVVDRNTGTPFVIYVEIGADFKLHRNGWSNATANDLNLMRAAMRPVSSAAGWIDGNGNASSTVTSTALNLLSMRGAWWRTKGTVSGDFDTWRQALVFPATTTQIEQANATGRAMNPVTWATPAVGDTFRLDVGATGGASFRMVIADKASGATVYDSGYLSDGQSTTLVWPNVATYKVTTWARSGVDNVESTVRPTLVKTGGPAGSVCAG